MEQSWKLTRMTYNTDSKQLRSIKDITPKKKIQTLDQSSCRWPVFWPSIWERLSARTRWAWWASRTGSSRSDTCTICPRCWPLCPTNSTKGGVRSVGRSTFAASCLSQLIIERNGLGTAVHIGWNGQCRIYQAYCSNRGNPEMTLHKPSDFTIVYSL